ncbi:MAG TPA: redoxin domain-containing protein [Chloroflexia bacterium]|jgi:peroxiredoxin
MDQLDQLFLINAVATWLMVALNLVLVFAIIRKMNTNSVGTGKSGPFVSLKPGEPAPDFVAQTLDGRDVTLANFSGKTTAFLIIGPQCAPCMESLPKYEALYPLAAKAGVELVLVSTGDVTATTKLVNESKIRTPIIVAPPATNSFLRDYGVSGTPAYCLVSPEGKVQSAGFPDFSGGDWKKISESWQVPQASVTELAAT